MPIKIFWTNLGFLSLAEFKTVNEALVHAKSLYFEATLIQENTSLKGFRVLGSWTALYGYEVTN